MIAATAISVEEYLRTAYHPDCDYVNGEVLERNVGEREHSSLQVEIAYYFRNRYPALRGRILAEQRVQVTNENFRIPDLCVLGPGAPLEPVIHTAPALCIEILSPNDTMWRLTVRIKEYLAMGVPVCWILDPVNRVAWTATPGHMDEAENGVLRAGALEMVLAEVFEAQ